MDYQRELTTAWDEHFKRGGTGPVLVKAGANFWKGYHDSLMVLTRVDDRPKVADDEVKWLAFKSGRMILDPTVDPDSFIMESM